MFVLNLGPVGFGNGVREPDAVRNCPTKGLKEVELELGELDGPPAVPVGSAPAAFADVFAVNDSAFIHAPVS